MLIIIVSHGKLSNCLYTKIKRGNQRNYMTNTFLLWESLTHLILTYLQHLYKCSLGILKRQKCFTFIIASMFSFNLLLLPRNTRLYALLHETEMSHLSPTGRSYWSMSNPKLSNYHEMHVVYSISMQFPISDMSILKFVIPIWKLIVLKIPRRYHPPLKHSGLEVVTVRIILIPF